MLWAMQVWAQRPIYTLNQFTPQLVNPALASYDYKAELSLLRDEITIATGEYFSTNSLNADYVFVQKNTGRKWLGIGANVLSQDTGGSDLLKTYRAGLSLATPVQLAQEQFLHLGINATYVNTRTSLEQLSTGSQWIASEFRYDPTVGIGETFQLQKLEYFTLSAGLLWSWEKEGRQKAKAGIAVWDANRPDVSFFDEAVNLPLTFQINGEAVVYDKYRVRLTPSFYYQRNGQVDNYTALLSTKLFFHNDNPYDIISSGNIDLIARYGFNKDASVGLVFNQPKFALGFSYNFPLGKEDQYIQRGLQIGLSLNKLLWKPKVKRIKIDSYASRRDFDFQQRERQKESTVTYQESEVEQMKAQLEGLGDVKTLQFELSKDFRFEHGEAQLDGENHSFLDDVEELLTENPAWTLQIIGHTDNVGAKQDNYKLSVARAQVVADYLLSQGVSEEQVIVTGRGDTEPLAENDSEEGKAKNRRVQFLINVINE